MSEESPGGPGQYTAGMVVAGYRLEQQIGHGGMAVVFRAHDPRLNRDVALKILAPNLAYDDAFRKRFIRESRAAAALDDPHVIPVFEAGETDGVLFIAMRFVRGGDVRTLLDQAGPLSPARAVEIVAQAASALDSAHASGLVHRDVKPANMLLDSGVTGDRPDHVYLSDFGLSKMSLALTGLTASGQFLGTLEYTAPEQILGQKVDGRADQYGLACATMEMFTGAPPFRRDQPMALMYAHVNDPPPRLSRLRPELGRAADDVLDRALAKFPEDRFTSCREFAAALRQAFHLGYADFEAPAAAGFYPGVPTPGVRAPGVPAPGVAAPAGFGQAAAHPADSPPPGPAPAAPDIPAPAGGAAAAGVPAPGVPASGVPAPGVAAPAGFGQAAAHPAGPPPAGPAPAAPDIPAPAAGAAAAGVPAPGVASPAGFGQAAAHPAGPPPAGPAPAAPNVPAPAAGAAAADAALGGPPTQSASHPSEPPSPPQALPNSSIVTSGPPTQTASHPSQPQLTAAALAAQGPPAGPPDQRAAAQMQAPGQPGGPPQAGPAHPNANLPGQQPAAQIQLPGQPAGSQPEAAPAQPSAGIPTGPGGAQSGSPGQPGPPARPPQQAGLAQPAGSLPGVQAGPRAEPGWQEPLMPPGGPETPPMPPSVQAAWPPGPLEPARDPAEADTEPGVTSAIGPSGQGASEPGSARRSWWRSPILAAAASIVIVLGVAGVYFLTGQGQGATGGGAGGSASGRLASHRSHVHHRPTGPVTPGCITKVPKLTPLRKVSIRTIKAGTAPYALQHSTNGRYTFVTVHNGIDVYRNNGGLSLSLLRKVPLTGAGTGLVTTTDGNYLIAAVGSGAAVLSVSDLMNGTAHPVLGMLTSPNGSGAATPVLSDDGNYLFVSLAGSNAIAVFDFSLAAKSGFHAGHFIGDIPVGVQPDGMRIAVDQNYLYATSLQRTAGPAPSEGTLSVIDVDTAEKDPAKSVRATVDAGCSPERIYPDGNTVWVTAKDSNALLAFSASNLLSNPAHALTNIVPIGPGPVGVTPLSNGRIIITDTGTHGDSGNIAIISGDTALAGKPSLLGVIPVSGEPYQLTRIENHDTLLVTDMATGQLLALNITQMP